MTEYFLRILAKIQLLDETPSVEQFLEEIRLHFSRVIRYALRSRGDETIWTPLQILVEEDRFLNAETRGNHFNHQHVDIHNSSSISNHKSSSPEHEIHLRGFKVLYTSAVDVEDLLSEKKIKLKKKSPVRGMTMFWFVNQPKQPPSIQKVTISRMRNMEKHLINIV
jgi:hypothetical protein